MIAPTERYDWRDYLVDAGRALGHKLRYEKRSYLPTYTGTKMAWSWARCAGRVAWLGVYVFLAWLLFH
jgi:hypothetical protein